MADFFAMGGYAAYIWPAYGLTAVVMIGLLLLTLRELRDNEATLKALESVRPGRRGRRGERNIPEPAAATSAATDNAPATQQDG